MPPFNSTNVQDPAEFLCGDLVYILCAEAGGKKSHSVLPLLLDLLNFVGKPGLVG